MEEMVFYEWEREGGRGREKEERERERELEEGEREERKREEGRERERERKSSEISLHIFYKYVFKHSVQRYLCAVFLWYTMYFHYILLYGKFWWYVFEFI